MSVTTCDKCDLIFGYHGYLDIMDIWIFGYHGYLDIMDIWILRILGHHGYLDITDIWISWIARQGAIHLLCSHRGGGRGVRKVANCANDSTDRLRENANKGGEGVQNPENFANVINGCPLSLDEVKLKAQVG